ncbi:hypothetical protein PROFUN_12984 [Planoprotostelium fungivorum]|uniref:Uncharacterized protein n=1 Tax=Planoprotostelium fungivorum TaxID=1890364 RepID=A0A2P6N604_9EUKA|nr:hypothetical protein PROFUN_12984 [Planoprotostelium fungivorum]
MGSSPIGCIIFLLLFTPTQTQRPRPRRAEGANVTNELHDIISVQMAGCSLIRSSVASNDKLDGLLSLELEQFSSFPRDFALRSVLNPYKGVCRSHSSRIFYRTVTPTATMKVAIIFAIFCLAVFASEIAEDFPQPPYNVVDTWSSGDIVSLTCPDNCGNPDSKHCLWNADIQDTCSATYAEKRSVEEKRQGRCQQLGACGPVCWSDGQGGYACGCVSCGKK